MFACSVNKWFTASVDLLYQDSTDCKLSVPIAAFPLRLCTSPSRLPPTPSPLCSVDTGELVGPMQAALAIPTKLPVSFVSPGGSDAHVESLSLTMPAQQFQHEWKRVGRRRGDRIREWHSSLLPAVCQQDGASLKIIKALES